MFIPKRPLTIMMVAIEPSADALGASVLKELRTLLPHDTDFIGCGGRQMAAEGIRSCFDVSTLAVLGPMDVLRAYPEGRKRAKQLAQIAQDANCDMAIFIDGWLFSKAVARQLRKTMPTVPLIKFVAPQVWASRPRRVHDVKMLFDSVLTLFPFEPPLFKKVGVDAHFVGNPNFEAVMQAPLDRERFRKKYHLGDVPVLALLPGSRKGEVTRLSMPFGETVKALATQIEALKIVVPVAPAVHNLVQSCFAEWSSNIIFVPSTERFDAFNAADVALAASGTVATEIAITRTPLVVAYKTDWFSYVVTKCLLITDYVSILNIMAQREIIPEYIQNRCTPAHLVPALRELLLDTTLRQQQLQAFDALLPQLKCGEYSAASRAATIMVKHLNKKTTLTE